MASEIKFRTRGELDVVNLTIYVEKRIGIRDGVCTVSALEENAAIILNENESGLLEDFRALTKRISAEKSLPRSVSIPISNSTLRLGTWQRILFVELGKRPGERKVLVDFKEST